MELRLYRKKRMAQLWADIGKIRQPDFKPDKVSRRILLFFSTEREKHYPQLIGDSFKGLLLMGDRGVGKSYNFKIYRSIQSRLGGDKMVMIGAIEIESNYRVQGESYLLELSKIPELLIEDIGTEKAVLSDFGTKRNVINDLLMMRYEGYQNGTTLTHATTNLTREEIKERYDSRVYERIKEMFILSIVKGESKR